MIAPSLSETPIPHAHPGGSHDFIKIALRNKTIILSALLMAIAAAVAAHLLIPARYAAEAVVALDVRKTQVIELDRVISRLPQENPVLRTELDVISSRSMAETVMRRLNLEQDPDVPGATDAERTRNLIDRLVSSTRVSNDGRSYTIFIAYIASDPQRAALFANAYAESYLEYQTNAQTMAMRSAADWLGRKVDELRAKVQASDMAVEVFRANAGLVEIKGVALRNDAKVQLDQLEREATANRAIYESYLKRYKQTIEQDGLAAPEARLISRAQPPRAPSGPGLFPLLALATVVGSGFGFAAAFLKERLDTRIRDRGMIEEITGLPVLGLIPKQEQHRRGRKSKESAPKTAHDEALEKLQATLRYSRQTREAKVLSLTSCGAAEERNGFCMALAASIAQSGRKVIVIDAELRLRSTASLFGMPRALGLGELSGQMPTLPEIIRTNSTTKVDLITTPPTAHQSPRVLSSDAFRPLLHELRQRYDTVLIDTPPVNVCADAATVGGLADVSILVVRWGGTTNELLAAAVNQLRLWGVDLAGIVVDCGDVRAEAPIAPSVAAESAPDGGRPNMASDETVIEISRPLFEKPLAVGSQGGWRASS